MHAVEQHVVDRAFFVVIAIGGLERGGRCHRRTNDRAGKLPPQHFATLLRDEAQFGETGLPDQLLEALAVELAVRRLKRRIGHDPLSDLGIGDGEPQLADPFVEHELGNDRRDDLAVEARGARLIESDVAADLAAELLQAIPVERAELLDRDLGRSDLGEGRAAEAAENIADAPDREADDQKAHDRAQDGPANPALRGLSHSSKHRQRTEFEGGLPVPGPAHFRARIIGRAPLRRNSCRRRGASSIFLIVAQEVV